MKASSALLPLISPLLLLAASCAPAATVDRQASVQGAPTNMLDAYVNARCAEFDTIEPERRAQLLDLAALLRRHASDETLPITFICTHNSRRSQLAQIWARVAAERSGIAGVQTFSGGTEETAFNRRAVDALRRAGFDVEQATEGDNPRYLVHMPLISEPLECHSKTFDDPANPSADFVAVMTCSSADKACPFVPGARERFALTYLDPKDFDGTDRETAAYDERCAQIARELLFVFDNV